MGSEKSKAESATGGTEKASPAPTGLANGLTAREVEELIVIAEIGRTISSSLDMEKVFSRFVELVRPLIPFDRVVINSYDPSSDMWTDLYVFGAQLEGYGPGAAHPGDKALASAMLKDGKALVMDEAALKKAAETYRAQREGLAAGLRSMMVVPLIWQNSVLGNLNFRSRSPNTYGPDEQATAERIGAQIAGAMASNRMFRQLEREAEVRQSLASIGLAASRDLDLEKIFARTADEVSKILRYDRLSITLFDKQTAALHVRYFRGIELPERPLGGLVPIDPTIPRWRSMFQRSIEEGVFLGSEAELRSTGGRSARHMPARVQQVQSRLEVPLGTEAGGAIGYLGLSSVTPGAFSLDDLALLEKVAIQITPAIQNAIVHQSAVELAEEKARTTALETHTRELERLNHAKSQFLSTVTHELKTPLTSIMAFADILSRNRNGNLTDRQVEQINILRRNATHLHGLINDLLDISKTEAGRMALSERQFDLSELVREIASSMESYFASKKQTLEVEVRQAPVPVLADRGRIEQVITNLLSNAAKYSGPGTTVTVAVASDDEWCWFSVKDEGIGMSDEEQLHLFSPFYRSDNSITRESDGVGLGLAIVKHIVDVHAGQIYVESAPGKGSTFTVHLPKRLGLSAAG